MPQYLSPGVYVEETVAGPRPIAGVSTSIAGMVGVTVRGPSTGKPQLVTNFLDFTNTFGGFLPLPPAPIVDRWERDETEGGQWWDFALSVKGFFDNGGTQVYVKRVVSSTAMASSGTPRPATIATVTSDAAAGATTLKVSTLIGFVGAQPTVTVVRGDDGTEIYPTTMASYSARDSQLVLAAPLPAEVRASRGDYVRFGPVSTSTGPGPDTLSFTAVSPGTWGNTTVVRAQPVVTTTLPLLPAVSEGNLFLSRTVGATDANADTVLVAAATGLVAAEMPREVFAQIGDARYPVTVGTPDANGNVPLAVPSGTEHPAWPPNTTVRRVRRVNPPQNPQEVEGPDNPPGESLLVGGSSWLYPGAVVQLDTGTEMSLHRVVSVAAEVVAIDPVAKQIYYETDTMMLAEAQVVTQSGGTSETISGLRLTSDDPASIVSGLANRSALIRATAGDALTSTSDAATYLAALGGLAGPLADGDDGYDGLSPADFVGVDGGSGARTGIVAMEDIDEIAICAVPGMWSGTVQSALVTHCETMKDRFAILDPRNDLNMDEIQRFRAPFDTSYAALYYPWLNTLSPATNQNVEIAPSGHIAGIYARTDQARGVHKAPANEVIRGILQQNGIAQDVNKRQQDILNPLGINALRFFPNQGYRVWGARTLSSDPAWRYINVRRLFLFLEESIDQGTQWVVFEPNNEALWALVRQTVTNFLTTVWNTGALAGTTPDEAFFVACDRTTMTEDDLQNGRLICVVGVAPVYPAEFVVFRVQQITQQTQTT